MTLPVSRILGFLTLGLALTSAAQAQSFNWQVRKGDTLSALIVKSPWSDYLQSKLPEFEALTGIKVNLSILPEQQSRQKLAIDFASGGATTDVFDSSLHVEKARFIKAGWYENLAPYLANKQLSDPTFRYGDFFASGRNAVKAADGKIIGLPYKVDVQVLYYRKDLFEAKGLKVPKTLEEFDKVAAALHDPPRMYGYAARGLKNANVFTIAFPMQYFKASFVDKAGKAGLDTSSALKALNWYADTLKKYAPPGVVSYNWPEVLGQFQQGNLAMFNDGIGFATQAEDPSKSKVAGKVGYAILPGNLAPSTFNALAISPRAKNKEAAYLFLQWATSSAFDKGLVESGITAPRASAWQKASNQPLKTIPWAQTYFDALKIGKPAFPEISAVTELRDVFGIAIVQTLQGADAKGAAKNANDQFQQILDSTEK